MSNLRGAIICNHKVKLILHAWIDGVLIEIIHASSTKPEFQLSPLGASKDRLVDLLQEIDENVPNPSSMTTQNS